MISKQCKKCVKGCKDCKIFKKSGKKEYARIIYHKSGPIIVAAATVHVFEPHQRCTAQSFMRSL